MKRYLVLLFLCANAVHAQTVDLTAGVNVAFPKFSAGYGFSDLDGGMGFSGRIAVTGRSGAVYFGGSAMLNYMNGSQQIINGIDPDNTERRSVACGRPQYGAEAIAGVRIGPVNRASLRIGVAAGYAGARLPTYGTVGKTLHGFSAGVDVQPEFSVSRHISFLACIMPRYLRMSNQGVTLSALMVPVTIGLSIRPR